MSRRGRGLLGSLLGLLLLVSACGEPYQAPDSGCVGCRDANLHDAGTFADAYTYRLPLTDPIGECLPADEAECGCIDGFRRCDTCGWCPTGFACDESAGVCRGLDKASPFDEGTWSDTCSSFLCHTGMVCAVGLSRSGHHCYPVSFCQAAAVAEPPVEDLHCVYSDGRLVIDGPPDVGACPVGDPRQPYCGGVCGDDLRCPRFRGIQACVAFSEQRAFGVCASDWGICDSGQEMYTDGYLRLCELDYGEPCACLVTQEPPDNSPPHRGYIVLASVCRDYQLHFPGSTECVDANWDPLPPP